MHFSANFVLQMFFGMIRQSCGGSDHPTPSQFLYSYRLLSANSVTKLPRRASVVGDPVTMLQPLKSVSHTTTVSKASVHMIEQHLDNVLQQGQSSVDATGDNSSVLSLIDHEYYSSDPENCILHYVSGYVAHKLRKFTSCTDCVTILVDNEHTTPDDKLIVLKTRGGLQVPSASLTRLLEVLERCVQQHSAKPHTNLYAEMLNEALSSDDLSSTAVGCPLHRTTLTARCIHFYIVTRLYFLRKAINRNRKNYQNKHKPVL